MRRRATAAMLAAALSGVVACGDALPGSSDAPAVPSMRVGAAEVRIGSVDDPDFAFSAVIDVAIAPDGSLHSLHANEALVRRWTPDGLPAGTIGREGEGPGEFIRPMRLGFMGDSLWVMDTRTYRATFFTPDGTLLGSRSPRVDLGSATGAPEIPPRPVRPLRDGSWLASTPAFSGEIAQGTLSSGVHLRTDADGAPLDTLWVQEWRPTDIWAILREGGGSFTAQPFGDDHLYHVFEEGSLVIVDRRVVSEGIEPTFTVTRVDPSGDTTSVARIAFPRQELSPAVVDSTLDEQARSMHEFMERFRPGSSSLGETREAMAATLYAPAHLPVAERMVVASDGAVWLARRHLDPSRNEWWILDPDGALAATVRLPEGFHLRAVRGAALWGTETDELDVSYIVRYPLLRDSSEALGSSDP